MRVEIFKSRSLILQPRFHFRLIGDNGEPIAQSEGYTQKHNALEVCAKYFPDAVVRDLSKDYESTWGR